MASLFRRCFIVLAAVLCCVQVAESARQQPVVRPASASDKFVKGGTTLDIDRHWGEVVDVPGGRLDLQVSTKSGYSWARAKSILKGAINSNPVKYAATAGLTYLIYQIPGASFDPVTGQPVMTPSTLPNGQYWRVNFDPPKYFSSAQQACRAISSIYNAYDVSSNSANCASQADYVGGFISIYKTQANCPSGIDSVTGNCLSAPPASAPFSPSDYDSLLAGMPDIPAGDLDSLGAELLRDFPASFDGPDSETFDGPSSVQGEPTITTTLDQVSGNTTTSETTPTYNFDYSTSPLTITTSTTTTTNTYNNGTLVSTTTTSESPNVGPVKPVEQTLEVPTDCDFMPTVCNFIDWVKTPFDEEEPDLSSLIGDEDYEKNIQFNSNATCPGKSVISTSLGTFEFDWQPGCDWAGMIKPFVIIAALIGAIYLNLGLGRSAD